MPRIAMETQHIAGSTYSFSGLGMEALGATEYTLVQINVDATGSTIAFSDELLRMLITAVEACRKSPRSINLLLRVCMFNSLIGVQELHGFIPLKDIDTSTYQFKPYGMTNLFEASYFGVVSVVDYGSKLMENDFLANAIIFDITDGANNQGGATTRMIVAKKEEAQREEKLESLMHLLVGINATEYRNELEQFQREAEIDKYIDAGDATPENLAKLATFVSQSVSSQSQALGTGGSSKTISATI